MPAFRTEYEKAKWSKLEKQASMTFERLRKGQGTPEDLKIAQMLVPQYGELASSVFNSGVDAINEIAKDRIKVIEEHRHKLGKSELTEDQVNNLMRRALEQTVGSKGTDLLDSIKTIVEASDDKTHSKLDEIQTSGEGQGVTLGKVREILQDISKGKSEYEPWKQKGWFEKTNENFFETVPDSVIDSLYARFQRKASGTSSAGTSTSGSTSTEAPKSESVPKPEQEKEKPDLYTTRFFNALNGTFGSIKSVMSKMAKNYSDNIESIRQDGEGKDKHGSDLFSKHGDLFGKKHGKHKFGGGNRSKLNYIGKLKDWVEEKYGKIKSKFDHVVGKVTGHGLTGIMSRLLLLQLAGAGVGAMIKDYADPQKIKDYASDAYNFLATKFKELVATVKGMLTSSDEKVTDKDIAKDPSGIMTKVRRNAEYLSGEQQAAEAGVAAYKKLEKEDPGNPNIKARLKDKEDYLTSINKQIQQNDDLGSRVQMFYQNGSSGKMTPAPSLNYSPINSSVVNNNINAKNKKNKTQVGTNTSSIGAASLPNNVVETGDMSPIPSLNGGKAIGGTVASLGSVPGVSDGLDGPLAVMNYKGVLNGL